MHNKISTVFFGSLAQVTSNYKNKLKRSRNESPGKRSEVHSLWRSRLFFSHYMIYMSPLGTFEGGKAPRLPALRIQVCPKKGINPYIPIVGMGKFDHQTY